MQKQNRRSINYSNLNISNQIMIGYNQKSEEKEKEKERLTIYLPAYISVKLDSIDQLSISENRAGVNLTIYFRVYFGDLGSQFAESFCQQFQIGSTRENQFRIKITQKQKQIIQNIQQKNLLNVDDSESQQQEQQSANIQQKAYDNVKNIQEFTIRKLFQVELYPNTYLTPFEIHDLTLCLELRTVKLQKNGQQMQVKLNLMSVDVQKQKMRIKCINYSDFKPFGQYDLAETFLIFQNTIERTNKTLPELFGYFPFAINNIKKKILMNPTEAQQAQRQLTSVENKNFQYATFHFPIYRKPLIGFLSIYLPLWALSIITLSLYFTTNWFGGRLIAIAALNLAFVPTIKIIRKQIPQTRHLTFLELGVYMQIASTFMLLLQNITKRGLKKQEYKFDAYKNGFYLTSLILFLIVFIFPLITLLVFTILRIIHINNRKKVREEIQKSDGFLQFQFRRQQWNFNNQAEQFFKHKKDLYSQKSVKQVIEDLKKKIKKDNTVVDKKQEKKKKKLDKIKIPYQKFVLQSDQEFPKIIKQIKQ